MFGQTAISVRIQDRRKVGPSQGGAIKLSRFERLVLTNQYSILEKVDPEYAEHYGRYREALQQGYELEYQDIAHLIDEHTRAEDDCRFVMDVLDMHRVLHFSYRDLKDKSGVDPDQIAFRGFDGNNEAAQLRYMRYLRAQDKWQELGDPGGDFNSHMPTLGRYREMLKRWKQSKDESRLTKEDILRITA